jgi:anti-sigma B factor antagonist
MDTAVGVFSSRDRAEEAVKELLEQGVPEKSIVFLTRSESEAKQIGREFGTYVGGFTGGAAGMTAGVVAATLLLPGIGPIFALGFGAAALLGLAGAGAGATVASAVAGDETKSTPEEHASEDAAFYREVLKEGRSLIIVRADSSDIATKACAVLDRLGLGMQGKTPVKMEIKSRQLEDIVILAVTGRITLGEGNVMLREVVRDLADNGTRKVVLNLSEVNYIDSSGVGELVKTHTTIHNKGGQLKLSSLNKRVHDLLEMTRLSAVFDIHNDEASAVESFNQPAKQQAVA